MAVEEQLFHLSHCPIFRDRLSIKWSRTLVHPPLAVHTEIWLTRQVRVAMINNMAVVNIMPKVHYVSFQFNSPI
jgi:hypothetical protein